MYKLLIFFGVITLCYSNSCENPVITSKSFTTQDATIVTNIAYISEFTVKCSSGETTNLYAEIDGNIVPVSVSYPNTYIVSWTEDIKTAQSGNRVVRIFDEHSYSIVRKTLRSGEDISSVEPLFNIVINHPGAYNGPWLKGELLATIVTLIIAYFAISFKSKASS